MDPHLTEYVGRVREIVRGAWSPTTRLRLVREAATAMAAREIRLSERARHLPETGHGRNLIHRDPSGFVVIAMVWPPGEGGKPHDHGTWGVVAVAEGKLQVSHYEREDDGSREGYARLRETERIQAGPGAVAHVLPPHEDFHNVENVSDRPALSIHTYGKDICQCNTVDLETGKMTVFRPLYTVGTPGAAVELATH